MLAPPNQGSQIVDEFGWLPGFHLLNGPACDQLGTGTESIPLQLGKVAYPVGVLAGTHSINWILSMALPDPDDGKVSVESTRVEGMADFMTLPVSHPFIMSDPDAIRQTLRFIEPGHFDRTGNWQVEVRTRPGYFWSIRSRELIRSALCALLAVAFTRRLESAVSRSEGPKRGGGEEGSAVRSLMEDAANPF